MPSGTSNTRLYEAVLPRPSDIRDTFAQVSSWWVVADQSRPYRSPREFSNSGAVNVSPSACPTFLTVTVTRAKVMPSAGLSVSVKP